MKGDRRLTDGELTLQHAGDHDFKLIELMVIEIRDRRQADLTAEEREALHWLRVDADQVLGPHFGGACKCVSCERHRLAMATLERLASGGGS